MDVYDDSPTLVTIWLVNMPKISILIILLQLLIGVDINLNLLELVKILPSVNILSNLLLLSSLLSLIIGAIVGLSQIKIKRLLAYSTINHVGFLLLALAVFTNSSSNFSQSIESFIFYIVQYTLTNLNIFLIILALSYVINLNYFSAYATEESAVNGISENTNKKLVKFLNISDLEYINSLKGVFIKNPVLSISLSICLFSFAGVPPLVGFFAKQQVLYSSNSAGYFFLSLVAILVSVISAFYYLKIIKIVFTIPATESTDSIYDNSNKLDTKNNSKLTLDETYEVYQNLLLESLSLKYSFYKNLEIKNKLVSNIHSFLIGILTIFIINFIFNPELVLNSIAIITSLCGCT